MVYIIKFDNYVKIGFTENPIKRISTIQLGLPVEIDVLLIIKGDRKLEKELHFLFRETRSQGEWFNINDNIIDYIISMESIDLRYKYGFIESIKNELLPIKRHRINCGLTLENLGSMLGITKQGMMRLEQSANRGSISLKNMYKVAEATGYIFEFRFKKKV